MSERRIPGSGAILAIAFLLIPIAGVAWWLNRPKAETVTGASLGDIDVVCLGRVDGLAPTAHLDPTVFGKVVAIYVADGQAVKAKDKLLRLDDESLNLRVEEAREAIAAAQIEIEAAELEEKLQPNRKMLQEAAIASAMERKAAALGLLQEKKTAKGFGTVTAAELIAAEAEVKQLDHLVETEKARLDEMTKLDPTIRVRAARSKKAMAETTLKQAEKAVRDCVLLAPSDGEILRVQTSVGETVAPGSPVPAIVFRPSGPLIIRAELEQEFLSRVKPGMKATIRDYVRPDSPTWNGTVQRTGNWVARKRSVLLDPGEVNDVRTVECIIVLDGKTEDLLIGQRMRVKIGKQE